MSGKNDPDGSLTVEELKKKNHACTDEVVSDLEWAFQRDYTDEMAYRHAGIGHDTFYRWCKESDEFSAKMKTAKDDLKAKARINLYDAIHAGAVDLSLDYLERREKSIYSKRRENINTDVPLDELLDRLEEPE